MNRDLLMAALGATVLHAAALTVLPGPSGPRQQPGAAGQTLVVTLAMNAEPEDSPVTDAADLDRTLAEMADPGPTARHPAPRAATPVATGTTLRVAATTLRPTPLDMQSEVADLPVEPRLDPAGPPPPEPGPLRPGVVRVALPPATTHAAGMTTGEAATVAVENTPPRYPTLARRRGHEGEVVLEIEVLPTGRCGDVRVVRTSGHAALDAEAIRAVRRWRFHPARNGDTPVAERIEVPIEFRLEAP